MACKLLISLPRDCSFIKEALSVKVKITAASFRSTDKHRTGAHSRAKNNVLVPYDGTALPRVSTNAVGIPGMLDIPSGDERFDDSGASPQLADSAGHRHLNGSQEPSEPLSSSSRPNAAEDGPAAARGRVKPAVAVGSSMAEALQVSGAAAWTIVALLSLAAVVSPLLMPLWPGDGSSGVQLLTYLTLLLGFYMAWNIGANDVANAMGTSVGSGALSLAQAVALAAVLEFSGAFLLGGHVSDTMQHGIVDTALFADQAPLLLTGMLSALAAAGCWLQAASFFGWPVSTTHSIVGALLGFGLCFGGWQAVQWASLGSVVASWLLSPVLGGTAAFLVYRGIRTFVYCAPNPGQAASSAAPLVVFLSVSGFALSCLLPGSDATVSAAQLWQGPVLQALAAGTIAAAATAVAVERRVGALLGDFCEVPEAPEGARVRRVQTRGPSGTQLRVVYSVFGQLQVLSACFMSFAHGANDVANAIGPISSALAVLSSAASGSSASLSLPPSAAAVVLAWGGFGIVSGLLVWGYRVIATIGGKITELTPTRGFAAEFSAASVVLAASHLGLPVSGTHTLVGAVMGVGLARGLRGVRGDVVRQIALSWAVTVPAGAALSVLFCSLLYPVVAQLL